MHSAITLSDYRASGQTGDPSWATYQLDEETRAYQAKMVHPQVIVQSRAKRMRGLTKLWFRVVSLVLSLIALCFSAYCVSKYNRPNPIMIIGTIFTAFLLVWDTVILSIMFRRNQLSSVWHPGLHVGVELVLTIWGIVGFMCTFPAIHQYHYTPGRIYATYQAVGIIAVVLLALLFTVRFALFVIACVDTRQHNVARRAEQTSFYLQTNINRPASGETVASRFDHRSRKQSIQSLHSAKSKQFQPISRPILQLPHDFGGSFVSISGMRHQEPAPACTRPMSERDNDKFSSSVKDAPPQYQREESYWV